MTCQPKWTRVRESTARARVRRAEREERRADDVTGGESGGRSPGRARQVANRAVGAARLALEVDDPTGGADPADVADRNRALAADLVRSFEARGFWVDAEDQLEVSSAVLTARHADRSEVIVRIEDGGDGSSRLTFDTDGVPHTHDADGHPDHACDAIRPVLEGLLDDLADLGCDSDGLQWPGQPQHRPDLRAQALLPTDSTRTGRRTHDHH